MVANPSYTSLGLEYFVQEGDELWSADDEQLIELAITECWELGLIDREDFVDGVVIRMPKAYPVYDQSYKKEQFVGGSRLPRLYRKPSAHWPQRSASLQ